MGRLILFFLLRIFLAILKGAFNFMIGFYNYTVILTYLSLVSAGVGMVFSSKGEFKQALFCLLISGLCDMFDGTVARTRKRTEQEKKFGIQIDSLCDCVSFCIQPAALVYYVACYGSSSTILAYISLGVGIVFALCGVIRLAYFNVTEEERQETEGNKHRTGYQGLPVTNSSLIIPMFYLTRYFLTGTAFSIVLTAALAVTAFLYVYNFKMFKLHGKQLIPVAIVGALMFVGIVFAPAGI